jgi:hypothetical protein
MLPEMASAVASAERYVTELSTASPPRLVSAWPLDLATACPGGEIPECAGLTGPGWGVVFDIEFHVGTPDPERGQVLVVLDADRQVLYTQQ